MSTHLEPFENMEEGKSIGVNISRGVIQRWKGAFVCGLLGHSSKSRWDLRLPIVGIDKIKYMNHVSSPYLIHDVL